MILDTAPIIHEHKILPFSPFSCFPEFSPFFLNHLPPVRCEKPTPHLVPVGGAVFSWNRSGGRGRMRGRFEENGNQRMCREC